MLGKASRNFGRVLGFVRATAGFPGAPDPDRLQPVFREYGLRFSDTTALYRRGEEASGPSRVWDQLEVIRGGEELCALGVGSLRAQAIAAYS